MLFFVTVASAADPSPTLLLPTAAPAAKGEGEVELSVGHGTVELLGTTLVGTSLRAGWAATDEVWLEVQAGGALRAITFCGIMSGGNCTSSWPVGDGAFALSGRYRVRLSDGFALAPVGGVFGGLTDQGQPVAGGALGVAIEGGGQRVRADLTLTLAGGGTADGFDVFPVGEGGVSFSIGASRRHTVRVGLAELVPDLSWRYEGDRWFVGAGLTGLPLVAGGERVTVGLRF